MPTLHTHPDNVKALHEHINHGVYDAGNFMPMFFDIRACEFMEKTKPTGRFVMPDGSVVGRSEVSIRERFVDYGPEDIDYLIYVGAIRYETEILVMLMDDMWQFRMMMDKPFVMQNRHIVVNSMS